MITTPPLTFLIDDVAHETRLIQVNNSFNNTHSFSHSATHYIKLYLHNKYINPAYASRQTVSFYKNTY